MFLILYPLLSGYCHWPTVCMFLSIMRFDISFIEVAKSDFKTNFLKGAAHLVNLNPCVVVINCNTRPIENAFNLF